jgi:Spy/CpxP family protein refolding chaperone
MRKQLSVAAVTLLFSGLCVAQGGTPSGPPPERGQSGNVVFQREGEGQRVMIRREGGEPGHVKMGFRTNGFERAPFPEGKWWKNSELVKKVGVTDPQVQQMEKIFQDTRLRLIDLHANLEKQEALLEPLVEAERPDETAVLRQIDKVASARAELEKANAQMLLGIRRVLSAEQWNKLKALPRPGHFEFRVPGPGPETALPPPPPRFDDDNLN